MSSDNDISSNSKKCSVCLKFLKNIPGRCKTIKSTNEAEAFSISFGKAVAINDVLCGFCRVIFYKKRKLDNESKAKCTKNSLNNLEYDSDSDISLDSEVEDPTFTRKVRSKSEDFHDEYICVHMQRTVSTHAYCCVCYSNKNLTVVPQEARIQSYAKRKIYIAKGNRCCQDHLIKNRFFDEDLRKLRVYSNTSNMEASELMKLMDGLSIKCDTAILDKVADFNFPEDKLQIFTGLNWENISELRDMMTSLRNSETRTVTQALIVFLFKLRTGNSNKIISAVFELEREQLVSEYSASIMKSFERDVLPSRFGFDAISRCDLIADHTTKMAKTFYNACDKLMVICDGTYARHQKSGNNEYQRKSFSGQKKVPLCKPFTVCTTNGYVLEMLGPYYANQNAAEIMKKVIENPDGLSKLMKKGDFFILDRGFRDVVNLLETKGYNVLMPALKSKRSQSTTTESNDSRFVTKIRWTIEAVHGMIKQKYQLLGKVIDNKLLPKVGLYFRIAAFLCNQFGKRLQSDVELFEEIVLRMKNKKSVENTLAEEVEEKGWYRKKVVFKSLSSTDILDFPEMTERDLKILFTGSYQLSQAVSYLAEMMDENGTVNMQAVKAQSNILKIQVQSRHISRKIYRCFIEYVPESIGVSGISRYACECANGRRTVGCCSHVAAIIYYLSHARYLTKIVRPAEILSHLFTENNTNPIIDEDSDED